MAESAQGKGEAIDGKEKSSEDDEGDSDKRE